MKKTEPRVYCIAEPAVNQAALGLYLRSIDAGDWGTDAPSDAELLVEVAGRVCYRSWKPGLNPNVTKVREGNNLYLANIINIGHGSVLEHAQTTWIFADVSRVFTHELVRHRVGVAISQESLRYVRLDELKFWLSSAHELGVDWGCGRTGQQEIVRLVERLETFQKDAADNLISNHATMSEKKKITSFMRRFAPMGLATTIVWSANLRTLRHVIEMRTSVAAEEEIRLVFQQVAEIARGRWPNVFADYSVNEAGEWVTENCKV